MSHGERFYVDVSCSLIEQALRPTAEASFRVVDGIPTDAVMSGAEWIDGQTVRLHFRSPSGHAMSPGERAMRVDVSCESTRSRA